MHDRRVDGQTLKFGNAGGLYRNAMTWYDHRTRSIWSQPWGRAIQGDLTGTELRLLPSQITTWGSWRSKHPDTLLLANQLEEFGPYQEPYTRGFVYGLRLDGQAAAYDVQLTSERGLLNDQLAGQPILVYAHGDQFEAYLRKLDDRTLTFVIEDGELIDHQTQTKWDPGRGIGVTGELAGRALQPIPKLSSFEWAWFDFYPDSELRP